MTSIVLSIRPALIMLLLCSIMFGVVYPFFSTIALQLLFFDKAHGSLIKNSNGDILGSALIGQEFSSDKYFWSRLSASSYKPLGSGGSNLSIDNPTLINLIKQRKAHEKPIPIDLVTASGSGLDPHISVAAAWYQLARVAKARNMNQDELRNIIQTFIEPRQFGVLGEPVVNVLKLNLALDDKI
jgi:K+-transporting ATPase ATPase C chain